MSTNSATIAFRVKPEIKRRADALFERLGMTTSTGMNILLMQTLNNRGFVTPIVVPDEEHGEIPNEATLQAIEDLDKGRDLSRYATVDAMLKDAL